MFICTLVALLVIPVLSRPIHASEITRSDSLEIGIHYVENVNDNGFHDFWRHGRGAGLFVSMPLRYGDVRGGVRVLSFRRKLDGIPGFQSYFFYLGMGEKRAVTPWLGMHAGIDVGSEQMTFDDKVEGGTNLESEFAVNLGARLIFTMQDQWSLNVSGDYEVIFTNKPIRLFVIAVGVSYSFPTPHWVKEFLR